MLFALPAHSWDDQERGGYVLYRAEIISETPIRRLPLVEGWEQTEGRESGRGVRALTDNL